MQKDSAYLPPTEHYAETILHIYLYRGSYAESLISLKSYPTDKAVRQFLP